MNPCRCGHLGDADLCCNKAPRCAGDYQAKVSGPMLDRMDLQVDVPTVSISDLNAQKGESSAVVAARVLAARETQAARYRALGVDIELNAQADGAALENVAVLAAEAKDLLDRAMESAKLSARGYFRVLRVARTIADLDGVASGQDIEKIGKNHIAEALSYRRASLS